MERKPKQPIALESASLKLPIEGEQPQGQEPADTTAQPQIVVLPTPPTTKPAATHDAMRIRRVSF